MMKAKSHNDSTMMVPDISDDETMVDKLRGILVEDNMPSRPRSKEKHRVQFSASSMLYLYQEDPYYSKRSLFFTTSERRSSAQGALRDALRVKRTLLSRPCDPNLSLKEHLESCNVPQEELLGIEHLVLEDPIRTIERRRLHVKTILMEQENQKIAGIIDDINLAKISAVLTKRPAKQARSRAAMAA